MLKALHVNVLTSEQEEIKVGINWKFSPCWLTFVVLEEAMQDDDGTELSSTFQLGFGTCLIKR